MLMFGAFCCAACALPFALPIPPETTYWAYGFSSTCICAFGVNTVLPLLKLFISDSLPKGDQAIGGALVDTAGEVGRAIGFVIIMAIQVPVHEDTQGTDAGAPAENLRNESLLEILRAGMALNVAFGLLAFGVVAVAFRGMSNPQDSLASEERESSDGA